jgi:hypothetical protein
MDWLRRQYKDIKGHLKWEIIKFVAVLLVSGGGLTLLAHWLQKVFSTNIAGWLALASPIFSILAVLYLLLIFTPRSTAVASGESLLAPNQLSAGPLAVDLRGEILELYFLGAPYMMAMTISPMYVLLKVQIVNHGPDQVTVKSCGLHINIGDFHRLGEPAEIPKLWRIKRKIQQTFSIGVEETPVTPHLGMAETYQKGIPQIGWLAFTSYDEHVEFPNATFTIHLRDSLGGDHYIQREPEVYKKVGELVVVAEKPSLQS